MAKTKQSALLELDAPAIPEPTDKWEALHLKYRPQHLDDLIGQNYIQIALRNALEMGQVAPAYAFTGPSGCGKTTTARIMAMALNCESSDRPTADPCGECNSCRSIARGNSLDVLEIDAASNNGVDSIRELTQTVYLHPAGRYRVVILDEAHQLSVQAQNALLKTLEEPPNRVVFILCTTDVHKMLTTIIGRCQQFQFRSPGAKTLAGHLMTIAEQENIELTEAIAMQLAMAADGHVRDAIQLLGKAALNQPITPEKIAEMVGDIPPKVLFAIVKALANNQITEPLQLVAGLLDEGKEAKRIITSLTGVFRDLLLLQQAGKDADPKDLQSIKISTVPFKNLQPLVGAWEPKQLEAVMTRLHQSERQLFGVGNPNVWLDVCLLNLTPRHLQSLEAN